MRKIFVVLMLVVFAVSVAGCASVQFPQNIAEKSANYVKGKTTFEEVVLDLGDPRAVSLLVDGKKSVIYTDANLRGTMLQLIFDDKNILFSKLINKF